VVAGASFVFPLSEIALVLGPLDHVWPETFRESEDARVTGGLHEIVLGETIAPRNCSLAVHCHVHDAA
jgi:hypothetical protein